jgi:leucyl aminopeptidase
LTATPIWFVRPDTFGAIRKKIGKLATAFAEASGFEPKPGRLQLLPAADGALAGVLFGEDPADPMQAGWLATSLPPGVYRFATPPLAPDLAELAFHLARYRFDRFKAPSRVAPSLESPTATIEAQAAAIAWGRDLVNLPANVLTPSALEKAAVDLGAAHGARTRVTSGEALAREFPLVAAVGAAAAEPPRLVDFRVGPADAPKVTLVGKGVTFDTGGLDIKAANGMELMKKDMGGAATALTLARLVMEARLPVRLRVLIPIVENAIAGPAMRPSDIYRSRKRLTVEIGNTDAEGRLIVADALSLAAEEAPDLLFDFATLTGAARVALGPEIPPFYTDDDGLAAEIASHSQSVRDPVWRLPLWRAYEPMLESAVADLTNAPAGGFAGSITAALFLKRFAEGAKAWAHFDIYAWNPKPRATGPQGGEIQVARALFALLAARFPRA